MCVCVCVCVCLAQKKPKLGTRRGRGMNAIGLCEGGEGVKGEEEKEAPGLSPGTIASYNAKDDLTLAQCIASAGQIDLDDRDVETPWSRARFDCLTSRIWLLFRSPARRFRCRVKAEERVNNDGMVCASFLTVVTHAWR